MLALKENKFYFNKVLWLLYVSQKTFCFQLLNLTLYVSKGVEPMVIRPHFSSWKKESSEKLDLL